MIKVRRGQCLIGSCFLPLLATAVALHLVCSPSAAGQSNDKGRALELTVLIQSAFADQSSEYGGGVICARIGGKLIVATAFHVVKHRIESGQWVSPSKIRVRAYFEPTSELIGRPIPGASSEQQDLALIEVDCSQLGADKLEALDFNRIGEPLELKDGEGVWSVLNDGENRWEEPKNRELFKDRIGDRLRFISDHVRTGSSGCGVFNSEWRLIGLVTTYDGKLAEAKAISTVTQLLRSDWSQPGAVIIGTPVKQSGGKLGAREMDVVNAATMALRQRDCGSALDLVGYLTDAARAQPDVLRVLASAHACAEDFESAYNAHVLVREAGANRPSDDSARAFALYRYNQPETTRWRLEFMFLRNTAKPEAPSRPWWSFDMTAVRRGERWDASMAALGGGGDTVIKGRSTGVFKEGRFDGTLSLHWDKTPWEYMRFELGPDRRTGSGTAKVTVSAVEEHYYTFRIYRLE